MEFQLLGPLQVTAGGEVLQLHGGRMSCVLATLLIYTNRTVTIEQLTQAVWSKPPRAVRSNLRTYIARLRSALLAAGEPASRVVTEPAGYRLRVGPGELDLAWFDEFVEAGEEALARGDIDVALDRLRRALDLWRGRPLAGLTGGLQLDVEVARLEERRLLVTEWWADAALAAGRHEEASVELGRLARAHPLRERIWMQLMLALSRSGRQAAALAAYQDVYRLLDKELGIAPSKPLQRLHHQILTADPALDLPERVDAATVSRPDAPKPRQLPAQLPADVGGFTGRCAELARLDTVLATAGEQPSAAVISVVSGSAGVGKTALAVHWAHRVADQFPDGQLYVNLRGFDPTGSAMNPAEGIRGFLDAFAVPPQRIPVSLDAQAALYRSVLAGRKVLVVLDNARDADQVRPLLPGSPGCLVVVTSRDQLTSLVAVEGAHPLTLDVLAPAEARDLLARRIGPHRVAAEPQAASEITTLCARLPLALATVAARAATHPAFPLSTLAGELRDTRGRLNAFGGGDAATDVRAVFSWSYHTLSTEAARLFRLLGLHSGPDIAVPAAASLAGTRDGQVRPLVAELARAHLVAEHAPGRYSFHDLLRAYASELAEAVDAVTARRAALHRLLDHYLHTAHAADRLLRPHQKTIPLTPCRPGVAPPEDLADHRQALAWFTTEHAVLLTAINMAAGIGFDTQAWQLAWTLTEFFDRRGHWHDWAATQRTALESAQRRSDLAGQAHAHRDLGRAYAQLGRLTDAHSHLHQALDLFNNAGDQAYQAYTHHSLGAVLDRQGRHREALHHARQALDLFRAADDRPGEANALSAVGWYQIRLGHYHEAASYCRQALTSQREIGDRRGQAGTWGNLGRAHQHLGQGPQAIRCYQHALDLYHDLGDRYYKALALIDLGDAHEAANNPHAARDARQRALDILHELGHQPVRPGVLLGR